MTDIRVENYRRGVLVLLRRWEREVGSISAALARLDRQRRELEEKRSALPPDQFEKSRKDLAARKSDLHGKIERAGSQLQLELMLLPRIDPSAPKKDLLSLPAWLKRAVAAGGIPIGGGVSIRPDITLDMSRMGIRVKWGRSSAQAERRFQAAQPPASRPSP